MSVIISMGEDRYILYILKNSACGQYVPCLPELTSLSF
jgi:hypothetical protein